MHCYFKLAYYFEEDILKADNATEKAIKVVLEKFAESNAKQDMETALVSNRRSQIEDPALEYIWISISAADNVAWVAIDTVFEAMVNGQNLNFSSMVTKVLEKRGDRWLIVHRIFLSLIEVKYLIK